MFANLKKALAIIFPLLFFLTSIETRAQFFEGSILTKDGESLKGYARVGSDNRIYFKKDNSTTEQQQSPEHVLEVMVGNACWRSITVSGSPALFASLLLKGKMSVYEANNRIFVQKDSSDFFELRIVLDRNSRENAKYRGILNALASDCTGLSASGIGASVEEVVSFAQKYNECKGSSSTNFLAKSEKQQKIDFGLWAGITLADINTSNYFALSNIVFNKSSSFTIGSRVALDMSRSGSIRMLFDVSYLQANYTAPADLIDIKSQLVRTGIGVQRNFTLPGIRPYLAGGVAVHFPIDFTVAANRVVPTVVYQETKNGNIGIWAGLGVIKPIKNRVSVFAELRAEASSGYGARGGPNRLGSFPTYFSAVVGVSVK
jgi:hypothetical protein